MSASIYHLSVITYHLFRKLNRRFVHASSIKVNFLNLKFKSPSAPICSNISIRGGEKQAQFLPIRLPVQTFPALFPVRSALCIFCRDNTNLRNQPDGVQRIFPTPRALRSAYLLLNKSRRFRARFRSERVCRFVR